jgi:hypothetical protein
MRLGVRLVLAAALLASIGLGQDRLWVRPGYYKQITPDRWKARVAKMLKDDEENPPSSEGVMFVGSATIAEWDLRHYFGQYRTVKRGIGGSLISESTYYADQLIVPFKPSTIVFYSGDNDTAYGMTPDMVAADFSKFVAKIHTSLPKTQLVVMSIRPSIARLAVWDVVKASNEKIQAICDADKDKSVRFVDLTEDLLDQKGQPNREMIGDDDHHLNKLGFDIVSGDVKLVIQKAEARYWRGFDPVRGQ